MGWKTALGALLIGIGILGFLGMIGISPHSVIERLTGLIVWCGIGIFLITKDKNKKIKK